MARPVTPIQKLISGLETSNKNRMELVSMYYQAQVCKKLEEIEGGKKFTVNRFERGDGGGEIACVLQGGKVFIIRLFTITSIFSLNKPAKQHLCSCWINMFLSDCLSAIQLAGLWPAAGNKNFHV